MVLPTGAGKTVVFAHLAKRWLGAREGRVLVLAHRTELIEQAAGKIRAVAPALDVGIVKAERNQTRSRVVVGSVQTLRSENRRKMLQGVGLVIVDECHHATADSYVQVLRHYGCLADDGEAVAVGFTATMSRGDDMSLGDIWQDVVYSRSIAEMIHGGYLVRPRGIRVWVDDLDLSKVRKTRGDYREGDLGQALTDSMAPELIAKSYVEHASERQGILFAPTVESATVIGDAVREAGISTAMVWGAQPASERAKALDDFMGNRVQMLANCMVLTEGTDLPPASCAVIARPTTHQGLYVQMTGRVLRPWPGKADALVLDVVGASQRHALASPVQLYGDESVVLDADATEDESDSCDDEVGAVELDEGLGAGWTEAPEYRNGPVISEEVDLFRGSASAWLRTAAGVWFLPAGKERFVAIVPGRERGTHDVTAMHRYQQGTGRWIIQGVPDLSYAMAWAEGEITAAEQSISRKERGWRARRPTQNQRDLARRYGIIVHDQMLSGEVSNAITVAMATARIDSRLPALTH